MTLTPTDDEKTSRPDHHGSSSSIVNQQGFSNNHTHHAAARYSEDDDPYSVSMVYMLQMLLTNTPWDSAHDIYRSFTHLGATAYGHATCSPATDASVCEDVLP